MRPGPVARLTRSIDWIRPARSRRPDISERTTGQMLILLTWDKVPSGGAGRLTFDRELSHLKCGALVWLFTSVVGRYFGAFRRYADLDPTEPQCRHFYDDRERNRDADAHSAR